MWATPIISSCKLLILSRQQRAGARLTGPVIYFRAINKGGCDTCDDRLIFRQYRPYRYINYSYHYLSLCIVFQTTPPSTGVSVPPDDTDRVSGKSINTYTVTCVCVLLE